MNTQLLILRRLVLGEGGSGQLRFFLWVMKMLISPHRRMDASIISLLDWELFFWPWDLKPKVKVQSGWMFLSQTLLHQGLVHTIGTSK
jgi:hypothetical protein